MSEEEKSGKRHKPTGNEEDKKTDGCNEAVKPYRYKSETVVMQATPYVSYCTREYADTWWKVMERKYIATYNDTGYHEGELGWTAIKVPPSKGESYTADEVLEAIGEWIDDGGEGRLSIIHQPVLKGALKQVAGRASEIYILFGHIKRGLYPIEVHAFVIT